MSPFDCTAVLQMAGIGTELTGELGLVCSAPSQRTFRATFQNGELSDAGRFPDEAVRHKM